jgi:predicted Zn-dependent protease
MYIHQKEIIVKSKSFLPIVAFFLLSFLFWGWKQLEASVVPQAIAASPAFVDHMRHKGRLLVWQDARVNVYTNRPNYKPLIENAFAPWQSALEGEHPLNLNWVETPEDASLLIQFVDAIALPIQVDAQHRRGYIAGLTTPKAYNDKGLRQVVMQFALLNSGGLPQQSAVLERVMLHEMGHALGLWGHSTNPYDVMNASYVNTLGKDKKAITSLQQGDVKLIQAVYAQVQAPQSIKNKGLSQALALAKAEAEANPTVLSIWKYARALRDANAFAEASVQYQKALAFGSVNAPLYLEFVQCLERQAQNADALSFLSEQLPKGYVQNGRLQLEKAYVLLKLKRSVEAKSVYEQALRLDASLATSPVGRELAELLRK